MHTTPYPVFLRGRRRRKIQIAPPWKGKQPRTGAVPQWLLPSREGELTHSSSSFSDSTCPHIPSPCLRFRSKPAHVETDSSSSTSMRIFTSPHQRDQIRKKSHETTVTVILDPSSKTPFRVPLQQSPRMTSPSNAPEITPNFSVKCI